VPVQNASCLLKKFTGQVELGGLHAVGQAGQVPGAATHEIARLPLWAGPGQERRVRSVNLITPSPQGSCVGTQRITLAVGILIVARRGQEKALPRERTGDTVRHVDAPNQRWPCFRTVHPVAGS
jgi:hypothetical protein